MLPHSRHSDRKHPGYKPPDSFRKQTQNPEIKNKYPMKLAPRIYLWGQCFNLKSKISNLKSIDPAQKRIQVSDRSRPKPKIFDPSSRSQIHLSSKSQILRRRARLDGSTERSPNLCAVSNLKLTDSDQE